MKKIFAVVLALGFCLAITMPAAAAVSVSGDVGYEIKYETRGEDDGQSVPLNNEEYKNFEIFPNVEKAQIRFDWEAGPATPYIELAMRKYKNKSVSGSLDTNEDLVELRFGSAYKDATGTYGGKFEVVRQWLDDRSANASLTVAALGTAFAQKENTKYNAEIWWQVNPMLKLSFGKLAVAGGAKTAEKAGLYGGNDIDHLMRAEAKLPFGALTVDFVNPRNRGTISNGAVVLKSTEEINDMPGIAIALAAKVGPVSITPAYMSQTYNYEKGVGTASGTSEDSFTAWAGQIPIKGQLGPVGIMAGYAWGENVGQLYTKDFMGSKAAVVGFKTNAAGQTVFDNTEWEGWTVEADVNAGIGKLMAGYAAEQTDAWASATTRTVTDYDVLWVKYAIPVGKGFTITPKYAKFNDGEVTTAGVAQTTSDDKTRKIYCINFNVKF